MPSRRSTELEVEHDADRVSQITWTNYTHVGPATLDETMVDLSMPAV